MLRNSYHHLIALLALVLMIGLSACADKGADVSSTKDMPAAESTQPSAAAQPPVEPTKTTGIAAAATISCDQLIPPDEAGLLLTGLSPQLSEQIGQGETTCTWQYASKNSGQPAEFKLQVGYGASAVEAWAAARKSELASQPSDLTMINIDGLGDENYAWISKPGNQNVVYVRRGAQTQILHFQAADILYLANESGILDTTDRVFSRLNQ